MPTAFRPRWNAVRAERSAPRGRVREIAQTAQGPEVEVKRQRPAAAERHLPAKLRDGRNGDGEKVTAFCRCGSSNVPTAMGTPPQGGILRLSTAPFVAHRHPAPHGRSLPLYRQFGTSSGDDRSDPDRLLSARRRRRERSTRQRPVMAPSPASGGARRPWQFFRGRRERHHRESDERA